jgi:thiosulfate/3-mercaptopyruvate sulfurtransferase
MNEFARPEMLVDCAWLEAHMSNANLRIVDCDTRDAYRRAHIPGAVCPRDNRFKNPDSSVFVMEPEQFAAAMAELGIGDETEVVAYDASGTLNSGRFWWALTYYGHDKVRILNGGWNLWLKEGRPISLAEPKVEARKFTPRPNEDIRATAEYVMEAMSRPDVVIWDVRTEGEWNGTASRGNKRQGHIPGAVHLEWTNNLTPDDVRSLKAPDELREMLSEQGITPEKEVITV